MRRLSLGSREIGPDRPVFVIAEAGVNHDGSVAQAIRLVDAAAEAGADAVKFQTFSADRLATADAPKAEYQKRGTSQGESQREMLRRLELSGSAHRELSERARVRGVLFLSSPFDEESADFLDGIGVPAFKIPSGELTNTPFLSHVARKGKPMLVSTGMATLEEVRIAVEAVRGAGDPGLVLLQCVSRYPADPAQSNLRAMVALGSKFGVPVGYSDHTTGPETALAAVALGACVIEKHLTLDRTLPGPDHAASAEAAELKALIGSIRTVESALGHGRKEPAPDEAATARVARKSLVAAKDVAAGRVVERSDVASRRPGTGIPPYRMSDVVGRRARHAIPAGCPFAWEMLE